MILGIDASNIRSGGGVTHLVEVLRAAEPMAHGFSQVVVWSGQETLSQIEDRPWLVKSHEPLLDKTLLHRTFWQRFRLSRLARVADCDVLFIPGGSFAGNFHPTVTMSQNLLPFEWQELKRYGWSWVTIKLMVLHITQARTFHRADGLIFLTQYARDVVTRVVKNTTTKTAIVPHGVNKRFICPPRKQLPITHYSAEQPFRMLYISIVDLYKHQWSVAEAVAELRRGGLQVHLDLVGPAYPPALRRLRRTLNRIDPSGAFVRYVGAIPHAELHSYYAEADLCIFASSCENMPNIVLEAMASRQPVACSARGPMPEVLGEAGVYFDPEDPRDIAVALRTLVESVELRVRLATSSFERVKAYSWQRCADETMGFLREVARPSFGPRVPDGGT